MLNRSFSVFGLTTVCMFFASASPIAATCETLPRSVASAFEQALVQSGIKRPQNGQSPFIVSCNQAEVIVEMRAGMYRLIAPLEIAAVRRAAGERHLVLRGASDGRSIFSGAQPLSGWHAVSDDKLLERLRNDARKHVVEADLPAMSPAASFGARGMGAQGVLSHPELFAGGRRLPLARWPEKGYAKIAPIVDTDHFKVEGGMPTLPSGSKLRGEGFWAFDWADYHVDITANPDGVMQFTNKAPKYGARQGGRAFFYNAPEFLAGPGDWLLDLERRKIILWPPADVPAERVEMSTATGLLLARNVDNFAIENIDWRESRGNALVSAGGRNFSLVNCSFALIGNRAVTATGTGSAVRGNRLQDTGDGGIYVEGGDRPTLTPGNVVVQGNAIARTSTWTKTYAPPIEVRGVGNRIVGNRIENVPHAAVLVSGNDNVVADNLFRDVVLESGDMGAVYLQRNWTERGNRISRNLFENVKGVGKLGASAVYLDDFISDTIITDNVMLHVNRGVLIGGGRDNEILGNVFADVTLPWHVDSRGENWRRSLITDKDSQMWERLRQIPFESEPWRKRYPKLAKLPQSDPAVAQDNEFKHNVLIDSSLDHVRVERPEKQLFQANPVVQVAARAGDRGSASVPSLNAASLDIRALADILCANKEWVAKCRLTRNLAERVRSR